MERNSRLEATSPRWSPKTAGTRPMCKPSQGASEPPIVLECCIKSEVPTNAELDAIELLVGAELGEFTK